MCLGGVGKREKAQTGEQSKQVQRNVWEVHKESISKELEVRCWLRMIEQTRFCVSAQVALWVE